MAGHSKWANIKHKKKKLMHRGKNIHKNRKGNSGSCKRRRRQRPNVNSRLKDVIAKARANNMPNDNIMRSIKRAAGEGETVHYENVTYEGYGPNGVAVIVEVLTDNRNRTASEMRYIFDRNGGSLGATGCVAWMFDRKGLLVIEKSKVSDEDELMLTAIEAGAEDVAEESEVYEIYTSPTEFSSVREALEQAGYAFASAGLEMIPQNTVQMDEEQAQKVVRLIDMMEDNDDVQNVYHNADFPDDFMP